MTDDITTPTLHEKLARSHLLNDEQKNAWTKRLPSLTEDEQFTLSEVLDSESALAVGLWRKAVGKLVTRKDTDRLKAIDMMLVDMENALRCGEVTASEDADKAHAEHLLDTP